MKRARRQSGKGPFDLIEEAAQLLRTAPVATLAVYYLGAIPFVLGLLFFWTDMSRSAVAAEHLGDASLAMGLLFLWMKFCQTLFARRMLAQITLESPAPMTFRRASRIFLTQMIVQPTGLFLIPLSMMVVIPGPWVYMVYQNLTAVTDGEEGTGAAFRKSCRLAKLWPLQNCLAIAILFAFALAVFLSWSSICLTLPALFKTLFGIQSVFADSPRALLNSTFFTAMFGLTYLCVDPVLKTFYVLRCFYGESLQSGADLKAELKPFLRPAQTLAVAMAVFSVLCFTIPARGADAPAAPPATASKLSPSDLDQAINQTIHEPKFTWRMPREKIEDAASQAGPVERFFDTMGDMLRRWAKAVWHWLEKLLEKLFPPKHFTTASSSSNGVAFIEFAEILLWTLVAAVLVALGLFLYRVWQGRRKVAPILAATAIQPTPDVADENVRADELPEDGWMRLGRELLAKGEYRLAMRAFYLASLSHLAARNLVSIARFKSNREYERELRRRAHSFPELLSTFSLNILAFEQVWYGRHEINQDTVQQFAQSVDRLKAAG